MSLKTEIRNIRPDDIHFIRSAYLSQSTDEDKQESANRYISLLFNDIFKEGTAMSWVAEVDKEIAGALTFKLDVHPYQTPAETLVGDMMYVKRKFRNNGVAESLVEHVLPLLKKSGIQRFRIFLKDDNKKYNDMLTKKYLHGVKKVHTEYEWRDFYES